MKLKLNDEQKINTCDEEKDLGITFDKMLSFDLQIQNVINKANQKIGLIKRMFTYLNRHVYCLAVQGTGKISLGIW